MSAFLIFWHSAGTVALATTVAAAALVAAVATVAAAAALVVLALVAPVVLVAAVALVDNLGTAVALVDNLGTAVAVALVAAVAVALHNMGTIGQNCGLQNRQFFQFLEGKVKFCEPICSGKRRLMNTGSVREL